MKPTKFKLFKMEDGSVVLRGYSPMATGGYFNVEIIKRQLAGGSLAGVRNHARHLAKAWSVPLEDKLA
jgi:hypothetical protein